MDTSPAWRRVVFGLIVCVLAALGAYLLGPVAHSSDRVGRKPGAATSPRVAATPSGQATAPPAAGQPDIYQWLPFTQAGLSAAASVVIKFGDAYATYSYTQNATAYAKPLAAIASAQLVGQIEAAYAAPGVAAVRASGKQVSAGTTTIGSIRAFGPGSLTFVVQVAQQLTDTTGRTERSAVYAVTVTGTGTSWQVTDVELASAGNS